MTPYPGAASARGFLSSRKGVVALVSGLLFIPMLGFGLLAFEAINSHQLDARLGRASAVNSILAAKEGPGATGYQVEFIQQVLARFNTLSMLSSEEAEKIVIVTEYQTPSSQATYSHGGLYKPMLHAAITTGPEDEDATITVHGAATAERQRIRTEYALVLDASSSMRNQNRITTVREGLRGLVEHLFSGPDAAGHAWVSMVEFSDNVNIGARYADALVNPASRSIPERWDDKNNVDWEIAQANGGYTDFLDAANGPEAARKGACVARKSQGSDFIPLAQGDGLHPGYRDTLETPPQSDADKFDLLISSAGPVCEKHAADVYQTVVKTDINGNPVCAKRRNNPNRCRNRWRQRQLYETEQQLVASKGDCQEDAEGNPVMKASKSYTVERGLTDDQGLGPIQLMKLPADRYTFHCTSENAFACAAIRGEYSGGNYLRNIPTPAIAAFSRCGQPMLVASSQASELRAYIAGYVGVFQTAADEGFAWAYRALHPDWGEVWRSASDRTLDADVPAEFGGEVRKKLIYFTDDPSNAGYFARDIAPEESDQNDLSHIKKVCEYIKGEQASSPRQLGDVEVSVIKLAAGGIETAFEPAREGCPSSPKKNHLLETDQLSLIKAYLESLGRPAYRVRLTDAPG